MNNFQKYRLAEYLRRQSGLLNTTNDIIIGTAVEDMTDDEDIENDEALNKLEEEADAYWTDHNDELPKKYQLDL